MIAKLSAAALATVTRAELVKEVNQTELPFAVKMALLTALSSLITDEQFLHWRGVAARTLAALSETDTGRGVLQELGLTLE